MADWKMTDWNLEHYNADCYELYACVQKTGSV